MERALYDPTHGYYTAGRRSGAGGDFYTSVDAGPAFGRLLARQFRRMWEAAGRPPAFDLVEAGAGNGQLMRDVLDALAVESPDTYAATRITLVERSAGARVEHAARLEPHHTRPTSSTAAVPDGIHGVLFANELLDALPVHRVVATEQGLREVYVTVREDRLLTVLGPLSSDALAAYFADVGVAPLVGVVADVSLAGVTWVREAARAITRGYLLLIDYGHDAHRLFGDAHRSGTLRAYRRHLVDPPTGPWGGPAWLDRPGEQDLTAQVDFTAVRRAAELEGLTWLGCVPQGRWLLSLGLGDLLEQASGTSVADVRDRLQLRSLILPDGPAGTHHVLVAARGAGLGQALA